CYSTRAGDQSKSSMVREFGRCGQWIGRATWDWLPTRYEHRRVTVCRERNDHDVAPLFDRIEVVPRIARADEQADRLPRLRLIPSHRRPPLVVEPVLRNLTG